MLYQSAFAAILPLTLPLLAARRGLTHYRATLRGRLTRALPELAAGPAGAPALATALATAPGSLWVHAVSVGEVGVAATLLRDARPGLPLCVTTVTPTGQQLARRLFAGRAMVGYLPFELGFAVRRFFTAMQPRLIVLCEGDYWPLVLREARERQVPVVVVNGRLSDRAFARQKRLGRINRLFYATVDLFAVQTTIDAERLIELGVDPAKVAVTGNLKFDALPPAGKPELEAAIVKLAHGRPILVAGSTLEGEEEALLDALRQLADADAGKNLFLVLAPRHPERWDAVEKLIRARGIPYLRRSRMLGGGTDPAGADLAGTDLAAAETLPEGAPAPDILLLDSLGELAALYKLGNLAFVGGTLVPRGGHNPIEPALFGTPLVVGPSMFNFRDIAERFTQADAWLQVASSAELAPALRHLLANEAEARALGERARTLMGQNRGAVARTREKLQPYLDQAFGKETAKPQP